MRRIPPDVERLMWLVAEEHDPRAIADFEARFPTLKNELQKHLSMVDDLKRARRKAPAHEIPRFTPRYEQAKPPLSRGMMVVFAVAIMAVAVGAFALVSYLLAPIPKPLPAVANVPVGPLNPPAIPSKNPSPVTTPSGPTLVNPPSTETVSNDDPLQRAITLKVDRAPLVAAIAMVCKQAGLSADVGPGLSTSDISVDCEGEPAIQVLQELGQKYGFTPLPDEKGKILIIPVRPDGSPSAGSEPAVNAPAPKEAPDGAGKVIPSRTGTPSDHPGDR
ncbi:MAG TPA: hypothetical protein VMI31_09905 [Fimbriimonadaceae bacterium]|nr:hypothetical protein [Fimbriimonadaceae bacterium]